MSKVATLYIGIDPGGNGGIAEVGPGGDGKARNIACAEPILWNIIKFWSPSAVTRVHAVAVLEKVNTGFPGTSKSNMAKLYGSYRMLRAFLVAADIPFEEVYSYQWQKAMGIESRKPHTGEEKVKITKGKNKGKWRIKRVGGESDVEFKNRLKAEAIRLFPSEKVTLATCDALLIATYCKRKHEGTLPCNARGARDRPTRGKS